MNKLHKGILWGLVVNIPVWVAMIFILISVNNMLVSIKPEVDDFAVWKAELYNHLDQHKRSDRVLCNNTTIINEYERERDPYRPITDPVHELGCDKCHEEG